MKDKLNEIYRHLAFEAANSMSLARRLSLMALQTDTDKLVDKINGIKSDLQSLERWFEQAKHHSEVAKDCAITQTNIAAAMDRVHNILAELGG